MPDKKEVDPRTVSSVWVRKDGSEIRLNNFEATIMGAKSLGWKRKKEPKKDADKDAAKE